MFKKLQKSVIDKNKLLSTNLSKRRVNKTPSKIVYPNRTNLTFANIIVNMNSTPSLNTIDNWNNSYFTTELYNNNNSFTSKSKKNINYFKDNIQPKEYNTNSKILSTVINGIISLKSNDLLNYCIKLIEIMVFQRDIIEKNNFIDIYNEINRDLLMLIYQNYFHVFKNDSIMSIFLKNDLKKGMKFFQNIHSIYILYILSGMVYIYYHLNLENKNFYHFLKQFIKKEKCNDIKCCICSQINIIENNIIKYNSQKQSIYVQKPSVIKIVGKCTKKNSNINNNNNINNELFLNNNINKIYCIRQKKKYNIINNSNDNIIKIKKNNDQNNNNNKEKSGNKNIGKDKIEKIYYSQIPNEKKYRQIIDVKRYKNDIFDNKKKIFYSQIIKASEKEKNKFYNNDSFSSKEKSNSKKKYQIYKKEEIILDNSYNIFSYQEKYENNKNKKFLTEINDNRKKRKIRDEKGEYLNLIEEIKIKLYKNNNSKKQSEAKIDNKNKLINKIENNINNNNNKKLVEANKNDKNILTKNKKMKINISSEIKNKNEKTNQINIEKMANKIDTNIIDKNVYCEINYNINKSSKVIKENINAIEQDIKNFEEHNNYIKQQLIYLIKKK